MNKLLFNVNKYACISFCPILFKAPNLRCFACRNPQAFIDKFRFNAKRASMVQSRIKALNRLEDLGWEFLPFFALL